MAAVSFAVIDVVTFDVPVLQRRLLLDAPRPMVDDDPTDFVVWDAVGWFDLGPDHRANWIDVNWKKVAAYWDWHDSATMMTVPLKLMEIVLGVNWNWMRSDADLGADPISLVNDVRQRHPSMWTGHSSVVAVRLMTAVHLGRPEAMNWDVDRLVNACPDVGTYAKAVDDSTLRRPTEASQTSMDSLATDRGALGRCHHVTAGSVMICAGDDLAETHLTAIDGQLVDTNQPTMMVDIWSAVLAHLDADDAVQMAVVLDD